MSVSSFNGRRGVHISDQDDGFKIILLASMTGCNTISLSLANTTGFNIISLANTMGFILVTKTIPPPNTEYEAPTRNPDFDSNVSSFLKALIVLS